jgi:hypothetical protein
MVIIVIIIFNHSISHNNENYDTHNYHPFMLKAEMENAMVSVV